MVVRPVTLFITLTSTKLQYKKAIKDAFINFEHNNNDYMDAHFPGKSTSEFWKNFPKFRSTFNTKMCSI